MESDQIEDRDIDFSEESEVLDIKENEIDSPPKFGSQLKTDFIIGMGKVNGKIKILLNIEKILAAGEMGIINQIKKKEE